MANDYSIWSSTPTPPQTRSADVRPFGSAYGFNYLPRDFPAREAERKARENTALLEKIANTSRVDAFQVWFGAVTGELFGVGDEAAAKRAGAKGQPNWDYLVQYRSLGLSLEQAEDLGNFNYGVTGYLFGMKILTDMGISEGVADFIIRPILRLGGAAYQLIGEIPLELGKFWRTEHTWYGEEVKDISRVEAGMNLGQFLRLSMVAERFGVRLDPQEFGFPEQPDPTVRLLELDLSRELRLEELKQEIEDAIRQAEEETRERRMRDAKEGE